MFIVSVLRQSKDFTIKHAQWLHRQLDGYKSICMTDASEIKGVQTAPLLYNWPGWWAKLELFNPEHPILGNEDILYIDIDTVIVGDITHFTKMKKVTLLNDFSQHGSNAAPATGIMFIPAEAKKVVWEKFMRSPEAEINSARKPPYHGDQGFIGRVCHDADRWQDIFPGQIISYKANIATPKMIGFNSDLHDGKANGKLPLDAKIVCFHGSPRPWNTALYWVPTFSIKNTLCSKFKQLKRSLR
ncbi:hypothetical protein [Escherichia albertii]|uniref:hypothetical protein n=1 Tax=Escherichia albertii TaxID=208962 RepID=UPI001374AC0A|nr:hypothetical protein [Escherichia albertii]MCE7711530.1 hypothetical protein [Escherichia albertii]MCQ8913802.1 hypothetical protein [Escherichia albertii]MCQ8922618.1 hypothetical protein [Escherichia albertii]MCQ8939122.1 hypothetical protein [Escherichia albertii]MCQ8952671.1 hypothetical protein [Escherichia albertii]